MSILITSRFLAGGALAVAGVVMFLLAAFRHGASWAIACLSVPMAWLGFIVRHWQCAKRGVLTCAGGVGIVAATAIFSAVVAPGNPASAGPVSFVAHARAMESVSMTQAARDRPHSVATRCSSISPTIIAAGFLRAPFYPLEHPRSDRRRFGASASQAHPRKGPECRSSSRNGSVPPRARRATASEFGYSCSAVTSTHGSPPCRSIAANWRLPYA